MSFKRHRAQSEASSSSSTSLNNTEPTLKAQRTAQISSSANPPFLCTLPPTCHQQPTPIGSSNDLESHYATYHAHVCEQPSCSCVFPDARLLELHQTECHDPIAAVRKDKGEKIFACHLASCNKLFLTPKARRLHLIQGHGYPKEYFFAVTNKGVGGLLKRWGEGASLVRGQWKSREPPATSDPNQPTNRSSVLIEEDDDDDEEDNSEANETAVQTHPPAPAAVDSLAESLHALSLVPPSIRFGRGGKNGGFSNEQPARGGRSHRGRGGHRHDTTNEMDVNVPRQNGRGRGRGGPGVNGHAPAQNGRGGGVPGHVSNNNPPSDPSVLAYVPRGVRARGGMLHIRGGTRGRGV
ncbi:hypothetical protein R3P38DRAFT_2924690 [Favolaschia claudopus]|uniref:C2H2-type domain-containing protein n=1 Tax=Favolaschia claudopus TaxID=2862362 RepID=A0AAW0BZ83_9AGAR